MATAFGILGHVRCNGISTGNSTSLHNHVLNRSGELGGICNQHQPRRPVNTNVRWLNPLMDNPYESPSSGEPAKPKLGFVAKFALWTSWLLGWYFLVMGVLPVVAFPLIYLSGDATVDLMLKNQGFWIGLRMGLSFTVLGILLLWSSRRVGQQQYRHAAIGFVVSMLWASLAIPFLVLGHL